jgi:predicted RNase H-like HicB family nuclease
MKVRRFQVVLAWDADESVWVTYVPALNHLSTFGATKEAALAETREAILGYIEASRKEELALPDSDGTVEIAEVEIAIA